MIEKKIISIHLNSSTIKIPQQISHVMLSDGKIEPVTTVVENIEKNNMRYYYVNKRSAIHFVGYDYTLIQKPFIKTAKSIKPLDPILKLPSFDLN